MPDHCYSAQQVALMVDTEGLGYCVQHYLGADSIEEGPLQDAWRDAESAMQRIQALLSEIDSLPIYKVE